jgi:hypothetical protein
MYAGSSGTRIRALLSLIAEGADDGAADGAVVIILKFLLSTGERVGDEDTASVSILDRLLLLLPLILVLLAGLSIALPEGPLIDDEDMRNKGLATDLELSYGFWVHCRTAKLAYPPEKGHADRPSLPSVSLGCIM